jgi:DNA-binding phage protein
MKIKRVLANSRKRAFIVQISNQVYEFPYAWLKIKPNKRDPLVSVGPESEIGNSGFTYYLKSGKTDTILLEQVLFLNRDPEVLRKNLLFELTCKAQEVLEGSGLSKRALARQLSIEPTQLYRLLDQTFYGKTIDQMVKVLNALGMDISVQAKKAA